MSVPVFATTAAKTSKPLFIHGNANGASVQRNADSAMRAAPGTRRLLLVREIDDLKGKHIKQYIKDGFILVSENLPKELRTKAEDDADAADGAGAGQSKRKPAQKQAKQKALDVGSDQRTHALAILRRLFMSAGFSESEVTDTQLRGIINFRVYNGDAAGENAVALVIKALKDDDTGGANGQADVKGTPQSEADRAASLFDTMKRILPKAEPHTLAMAMHAVLGVNNAAFAEKFVKFVIDNLPDDASAKHLDMGPFGIPVVKFLLKQRDDTRQLQADTKKLAEQQLLMMNQMEAMPQLVVQAMQMAAGAASAQPLAPAAAAAAAAVPMEDDGVGKR